MYHAVMQSCGTKAVSYTHLDYYSYEAVELLKDKAARWKSLRRLRQAKAYKDNEDPAITDELKGPEVDIFVIDVSFAALKDLSLIHI